MYLTHVNIHICNTSYVSSKVMVDSNEYIGPGTGGEKNHFSLRELNLELIEVLWREGN